jgi:hypothetical protein
VPPLPSGPTVPLMTIPSSGIVAATPPSRDQEDDRQ